MIDAGPGPAIWDAFYPRLFAAAMPVKGLGPLIGTDSGTAGDFTDGGFWYLEKDLRHDQRRQGPAQFNDALLRRTATGRSAPRRSGGRSRPSPATRTR